MAEVKMERMTFSRRQLRALQHKDYLKDIETGNPTAAQRPDTRSSIVSSSDLCSRHTASTEAKSLYNRRTAEEEYSLDKEILSLGSQRFGGTTRYDPRPPTQQRPTERLYTHREIKAITERILRPRVTCCDRVKSTTTIMERLGVPPHLWGRQRPASKELIERLGKPTTSHQQRTALTLRQYRYRQTDNVRASLG